VDYEMAAAPVNICAFMAKIQENVGGGGNGDTDLYGLSLFYDADTFTVEPYYVARVLAFETKGTENDLTTAGVRATGDIPVFGGITLKGEFAKQFGDADGVWAADANYEGCAGYIGGEYAFDTNMNPTFSLGYNYFSGGKLATDTDVKFWVPVYPSNIADRVGKIAYAALFQGGEGVLTAVNNIADAGSGLQVINLGFGLQPVEKLTLSLDWYNLKLNEVAAGKKKTLGNEVDLGINYACTEDLSFGLDIGYLMKGKYIKDATGITPNSANAWQAIASMMVAF